MTTYLGKSCSFELLRVPFVNCHQFMYNFSYFLFGFEGRMWDLIVSVLDHCLSFYFTILKSFFFLPLKNFGMVFRFSRNRRFTTCALR